MRSLVHPSNVSPVLVDYPRYLHHQETETPLRFLISCLHGAQLPARTFGNILETCALHRTTHKRKNLKFLIGSLRTPSAQTHQFTSESKMTSPLSFSAFLFLATFLLKCLWVSGSPTCASCGLPAMEKGAEERLMIEYAKQQLLEKLHLKERPNITQTVPRAALLTALRKLHSGRVRQDGTLELENKIPTKDQGYEIVSFADISKSGIYLLHCTADFNDAKHCATSVCACA